MSAMRRPEIETAARRLAAVVTAVGDADLDRGTPCAEYAVAALLDHIDGCVTAFTAAGTKTQDPGRRSTRSGIGEQPARRLEDRGAPRPARARRGLASRRRVH